MIRIDTVTIKEFRGIRDLTLNLNGRNFAICGPNGTGKSGVVDALEFALTGNVSRLSGEGRGDISVKDHGPHVDSRNAPDKALVTVKVTLPSLAKTVSIERTVKNPKAFKVTPDDPNVIAILKNVEAHPEVVLSRRELIKYVLATPGSRAKEVQALLHLDQVEQVRTTLQKIANGCERDTKTRSGDVDAATVNLSKALEIPMLSSDRVLTAANAQRAILGLPAIADLTESTSLKDGLQTASAGAASPIAKAQALADIQATRDTLAELTSPTTRAAIDAITTDLAAIAGDPALASGVTLENFYSTGLQLVTAGACPLCDNVWDMMALKAHVQEKIGHLKETAHRRKLAEAKLNPLVALLRRVKSSIEVFSSHATRLTPPLAHKSLDEFSASCCTYIMTLSAFLPVATTIAAVAAIASVPRAAYDEIDALERVLRALPDPSKTDAARDWLTVAQERLEAYRTAQRNLATADARKTLTRTVSDTYAAASDAVLTGLYGSVQKDFAAMYAFVNRADEDKFSAKLIPSMGKLGFDVDFYGRGFFPPGAYHSEGHQDGMGVCLYLALMRHLQGAGFTFAILDDVLMSVDAGHRREVCALLKKEFPNTQFIMTTHDPIWLEHMRTEQLITRKQGVRFRKWDVDQGPTEWHDRDVWDEIANALKVNNVREAAGLLRRYLEYISAEICNRLRVPVEFRSDAQHQLGELLPPAINQMRKLYAEAKNAANSWGQTDVVATITTSEAAFNATVAKTNTDQWQVNASIHFNAWENLTPADFSPVAAAFRALVSAFTCAACSELMQVSPDRETREAVRCGCNTTSYNLKPKQKE